MLSKLIEESYQYFTETNVSRDEALASIEKYQNLQNSGMAIGMVPGALAIPGVGMGMYAGYKAGSEMGHPVAGTLLGSEGALGATSKENNDVTLKDAYNNFGNKAAWLTAGGALAYGLADAYDGNLDGTFYGIDNGLPVEATGAGLGLAGAAIQPGISYGLGKVFGKKRD